MNLLVTHSYFYRLDSKQWKFKQPYPPLGTLLAAAVARRHNHQVDFFDTNEFPTAKFQSSSITPGQGDGNYLITGNLTLLKVTKELKIPAKVTVSDQGLTLTAEFTIDRTEFGMSGFQDKVKKEVPMTVSIGQPTAAK